MKTRNRNLGKLVLAGMVLLTLTSLNMQAQPPGGKGNGEGPGCGQGMHQGKMDPLSCITDLTDEQKAKLETIMESHRKECQGIHLDIEAKEIELKRLKLADDFDEKAINQKIDEIYALKATLDKKRVALHNEFAKVLSPEQMKTLRCHKGAGDGFGEGHGQHADAKPHNCPNAAGCQGKGKD